MKGKMPGRIPVIQGIKIRKDFYGTIEIGGDHLALLTHCGSMIFMLSSWVCQWAPNPFHSWSIDNVNHRYGVF
jgi:hypothetical protein